ncbi:hypothetical protein HOD20_06810 [archaeon]|nr:hypothetical protein [archaeon]MBT4647338.1 hypothetical protein [archaeon]MBT6821226.1 hypothetical protein [archaeon]MBT7391278.1 hypothetical protein [archaeon]
MLDKKVQLKKHIKEDPSKKMKILVIGCGSLGSKVIAQLQKNENIRIITSDIKENPEAVRLGLIKKVNIVEHITVVNIRDIAKRYRPDLVFIARTVDDWGHDDTQLGSQLMTRMEEELNVLHIPIIPVSDIIDF